MKKLVVLFAFALFGYTATAQGVFKIGPSISTSVGETGDAHGIVIGADAYLYFTNIDAVLELGVTAGFRAYTGEKDYKDLGFEIPNQSYIPLGLAARVKLFGILSGGADAGYAFGLSDLDGGFYFRPVVGIDIADTIELFACFEYISNGTDDPIDDFPQASKQFAIDYASVGVGLLFEF